MQSPVPTNHHQAQTGPKEGPVGQRPRLPSILHPVDNGGHCSQSHRVGGKVSPAERPQEAAAGAATTPPLPRKTLTTVSPTPPTRLRGENQPPRILPQERSADSSWLRTPRAAFRAKSKCSECNCQPAPHCLPTWGLRFHNRKARSWTRPVAFSLQSAFPGPRSPRPSFRKFWKSRTWI